jgi:homoserine O-succinyltransferase/O-acetyltransferase
MPLTIDSYAQAAALGERGMRGVESADTLRIGLVNNMPDAALWATESQFSRLLGAAAGTLSVQLRFSYLPEIVRTSASLQRLREHYWPIDALLGAGLDALIVTGTEPVAPSLREERYWPRLIELLNWAETHTTSSLWSCLAAHAAALHLDGIARRRLPQKCCGIFEYSELAQHALLSGVGVPLRTPQSRGNELPLDALRAAGYTILSASAEAGVNICARRHRSLLIYFQGHPEYEGTTLLKEYRRDIERFASGQRADYPTLPSGYFSPEASARLEAYRQHVLSTPPAARSSFPYEAVAAGVQNTWRDAAVKIYKNWLVSLASARNAAAKSASPALL